MPSVAAFAVQKKDAVDVVVIGGVVDVGAMNIDRLHKLLVGFADRGANLVIDMTRCTYCIARGFGVILAMMAMARHRGGDLVVVGARGPVSAAVDAIGLKNNVRFYPDMAGALAFYTPVSD